MATSYEDVRDLARAAIGDFGIRDSNGAVITNSQDYHDDDIDKVINLVLLKFGDYSGDGSNITPSFATDSDKGAVSCYVALMLVLPGGTFSLEAPNMKYWVQANKELISNLLGLIKGFLDNEDLGPEIWGTLDLAYNQGIVLADRIAEAVGEY